MVAEFLKIQRSNRLGVCFPNNTFLGGGYHMKSSCPDEKALWAPKALTGMLVEDPQWFRESAQAPLAYWVSILDSLDAGSAFWSDWQ